MGKNHIIAIRLSAMGDVAMTVPVLRALLSQYPGVTITVVSRETFRPFFEGIDRLDFFPVDIKGRHNGFVGLLRLYKDLKGLNPDAVADLHNVLRSTVVTSLFSLSGKRTATINKRRAEKKALTRGKNKVFTPLPTVTRSYSEVLQKLGFVVDMSLPIFPTATPLDNAILAFSGIKGIYKWIGIAPFAQHVPKIYPADLMKEVIRELAKDTSYKIFLFGGGKAEIEILENFAGQNESILVVAGKLKLQQEVQLIHHLDVMLSMDSGNAHIAAMLGVPVVTLWGATHPYAGFAPFNQPLSNAITADRKKYPLLPTSIYGNKHVAGYDDAIRTILPKNVINKIEEILKRG